MVAMVPASRALLGRRQRRLVGGAGVLAAPRALVSDGGRAQRDRLDARVAERAGDADRVVERLARAGVVRP